MAQKITIKAYEVKTQKDKVLWHLKKHGTITTWDAFNKYRIMRLGSIMDILRNKEGYNIKTELINHTLASDALFPNAKEGKGQHAKYIYDVSKTAGGMTNESSSKKKSSWFGF